MLTNFVPITNESIIAELTQRCVDKDEEIARLVAYAEHWERSQKCQNVFREDEITRLKALCCEPVTLTMSEWVDIFETDFGTRQMTGILDAVNKKLKERK